MDFATADAFVWTSARLADRLRYAHLFHGAPREPVVAALRAHQNADGGIGNAFEPDLRTPSSQPAATLYALEALADISAHEDPLGDELLAWVAGIAEPDGAIPFMLPAGLEHPRAPWWQPEASSFLSAGLVAAAHALQRGGDWVEGATAWSWERVAGEHERSPYWWRYLVAFLNAVPDGDRAQAALERLREPLLEAVALDPAAGGELLKPLELAPEPGSRAAALFDRAVIERHLDALAAEQRPDGGWMFDFPEWSPAASAEWRGIVTIRALTTLRAYGRL